MKCQSFASTPVTRTILDKSELLSDWRRVRVCCFIQISEFQTSEEQTTSIVSQRLRQGVYLLPALFFLKTLTKNPPGSVGFCIFTVLIPLPMYLTDDTGIICDRSERKPNIIHRISVSVFNRQCQQPHTYAMRFFVIY